MQPRSQTKPKKNRYPGFNKAENKQFREMEILEIPHPPPETPPVKPRRMPGKGKR